MAERFDFATNRWTDDDPTAIRRASEPPLPTTEPRAGAWTRPPAKSSPPARIARAGMGLSMVAAAGSAMFGFGIPFLVAMWAGIVSFFAFVFLTEEKARPSDQSLVEDPSDGNAFVVVVRIPMRDLPSAADVDRGVAWFAEDKLFYSGRRTSFVIGGEDVLPKREWTLQYDMSRGAGAVIPLRAQPAGRTLVVTPLPGKSPSERARYARFDDALRAFRDHPRASDGLGRQWPPFERWKPRDSQAA